MSNGFDLWEDIAELSAHAEEQRIKEMYDGAREIIAVALEARRHDDIVNETRMRQLADIAFSDAGEAANRYNSIHNPQSI